VTLSRFPRRTLRSDADLYRIHRRHRGAWWFSAAGTGRFDPVGTSLGACYLAEQPLGAWVEVFRDQMLLSELAVRERALSRMRLGRDLRLADLTSRRALQFGVTASLGADRDYDASQAFAARAAESGFAGIRYFLRHDPAQRFYGVALVGEGDRLWPAPAGGPIPDELVQDAAQAFGYRIVPSP
jgi:RES domain-containing protein